MDSMRQNDGNWSLCSIIIKNKGGFLMLNIPEQVESTIKAYLESVSKIIPIDKTILFGSYAKGNFSVDSEIDLAIFSSYFDGRDRLENFRICSLRLWSLHLTYSLNRSLKMKCLNPMES